MRTLPQTIDNIKQVIQQFRELYDVKIFVHTWKGQDFKLLEPDYYRTTDQEEQFKNLKVPHYLTPEKLQERIKKLREIDEKVYEKMDEQHKKWHDEWVKKNKPVKPNNYYFTTHYGTYSRKQVTLLALSKIPNPELVVFIRPDTFFKSIDISSLLKRFDPKSKRIQIITPDFENIYWNKELRVTREDHSGKRGVNDRFAICLGPSAAKIYASQYDHLDNLEKEMLDFNGEIILELIFSHYNVLNIRSPMCFYLLRSDGKKHGWCKDDLKNRYKTDEKK
jgi:hypothetical protein